MPKSPKPTRRRGARTVAPASPQPFTPAELRARADGWTPERQTRFIEALAASACVEEACRSVGLSKTSAYRLRARPEAQAFRLAWDAAIDVGIRALSDACLSRALHGEEIPHFYKGELIGTHRRYDNRLAMFLLRYRDPLRYAASLDQMVYAGHPEGAAMRYGKALDRVLDETVAFADDVPRPEDVSEDDPTPWTTVALSEARARETEEALIESGATVHGAFERRTRIEGERRRRAEAKRYEEQASPEWQARLAEAQRRWDYRYPGLTFDRPHREMNDCAWEYLLDDSYAIPDQPETPPAPPEAPDATKPEAAPAETAPPQPAAIPPAPPPEPSPGRDVPTPTMPSPSSPSARITAFGSDPFSPVARGAKLYRAGG